MTKFFRFCWNLLNPLWHCFKFIWHKIKKPLYFLTALLRTLLYLFPATIFLIATWAIFWQLSQGKDVLIDMLEKKNAGGIILLALLFYTLVSWFSSRILIYRKPELYYFNKRVGYHAPRIIGFLGFSLIWIALLTLPKDAYLNVHISNKLSYALLLASSISYYFLNKKIKKFRDKKLHIYRNLNEDSQNELEQKEAIEKNKFKNIFILIGCFSSGILVLNTIITNAWLLFCSIIILQHVYLFIIIIRRGRVNFINDKEEILKMPLDYSQIEEWQKAESEKGNVFTIGVWERILYNANIPQKEKWFFITYNIITAISIIFFLTNIFNYRFSVASGSFTTTLISFGVLVGFFSLVSFSSVILKVNLHAVLWILIFLVGSVFEPHFAKLIELPSSEKDKIVFKDRPSLFKYFDKWTDSRKAAIEKDSSYAVFFVLSDGGASRSGYWTASVLSKLEDTTNGNFSKHLFCLSGASGGSVGNGTFLALLKNKALLTENRKSFTQGAQEYLRSDFLSYTLARTLGPDFFRPIIPLPFINDRAAALENAMEQGNKNAFLYGKFKAEVSSLIPFTANNQNLPIVFINTTRMQDGRPAVISTMQLDSGIFNKRIDILAELKPGLDMKLSTAVVMGARFPYLSPAGRIEKSYYVDGGYFDNSGAGIVNEMIIALKDYIKNKTSTKPWLSKIKFYVIHAQNGFTAEEGIEKIHPVINDLAAPVLTLIGAYGTQTSVNDWRLIKYLESIYQNPKDTGYMPVNLYSPLSVNKKNKEEFPMNWVISNYYINKMNDQLNNVDMQNLINWIQKKLQ